MRLFASSPEMGILDLVSNSKSQLKYLYSLSNLRFIRRISSPAAVDDLLCSAVQQSPHDPPPTIVGDLKSNNNKLVNNMLLIKHFHNGSGNYNPEYSYERKALFPPFSYSLISADQKSWTDHHSLCYDPFSGYGDCFIGGSCNELVSFFFKEKGDRIALWNPTTNKIKILPQSHVPARRPGPAYTTTIAHGFGFDHESEDYKVLRFIVFGYKDGSDTYLEAAPHVELYSLKTNSWKEINMNSDHGEPHQSPSIHVNGVYYWVDFALEPPIILSFDFANEEFSEIPLPPQFDDRKEGMFGNFVPVEFDGSLAALVHSKLSASTSEEEPFSFEVWGWNGESWLERVSRITIHVPGGVVKVMGLFQDDKLFLHSFKKGELMLFDLAKRKLENLGIHADTRKLQIFPYVSVKQSIEL